MGRVVPVTRALVALALLLALVEQTDTATAQGDALFRRAVAVAESDAHPPYATYDVIVSFTNGRRHIVDTWATTEDLTHAAVLANAFSEEERSAPTTPHGTNIVARRRFQLATPRSFDPLDQSATGSVTSAPVNAERTGDPIGPVAFAVDQNFGLTPPRPYSVAFDARTIAANADGFTTIGRTRTEAARYQAAVLDSDGSVAHLGLTPLRDAYHNRLRELWVETGTAYVREAVVAGIGDRAPFDRIRWRVAFDRKDGGSYVTGEQPLEPLNVNGTLENLSITFAHLALLSRSPFTYTFGITAPVRTLHDP